MNYWSWLIHGSGSRAGFRLFLDRWLFVHLIVGVTLAQSVPLTLRESANSVLLPLAGIFVGLCFAWGGNATALLQTEEIEELAENHPSGLQEYAFVFQSAIFIILITLSLWGIAGLNVFDEVYPGTNRPRAMIVCRISLFFVASLTLRECWHVVLGAQSMLLARNRIRMARKSRQPDPGPKERDSS